MSGSASFDAFADRFDDAQTLYERVGFEAERRGELGMLLQTTTGLGLVAFFGGRWTDASREFDLVLALGDEIGANAHQVAAHAVLAGIALGEGRDVDADVHLAHGHDALRLGHHLFGVDILPWLTALRAEHAADIHAAFDGLWEFWHVSTNMRGLTQYRSFAPDLVRAAVATGHDTEATRVVTEVGALADRVGATSAAAAAYRCRALIAGDPVGLVRAAELLDTTPWRFDFARTSAEAAAALAAAGQHEHGRTMAARASAQFERIGAVIPVNDLACSPEPDPSADSRADQCRHERWTLLSPREIEVAELIRARLQQSRDRRSPLHLATHRRIARGDRHAEARRGEPDAAGNRRPPGRTEQPLTRSRKDDRDRGRLPQRVVQRHTLAARQRRQSASTNPLVRAESLLDKTTTPSRSRPPCALSSSPRHRWSPTPWAPPSPRWSP